jgi:signal recognition particle subunit SRP19
MAHARVEELSDTDSDPEIMDLSSLSSAPPPYSSIAHHQQQQATTNPTLLSGPSIPTTAGTQPTTSVSAATKTWLVLYPLYFDSRATRAQGRRVSREQAVENPLAQMIANAVREKGLTSIFEPVRTHPKDWANPGRVRVRMRDDDGKWVARGVKNSMFGFFLFSSS